MSPKGESDHRLPPFDEWYGSAKQVGWALSIVKQFLEHIGDRELSENDRVVTECCDAVLIIDNRDLVETGDAESLIKKLGVAWCEFDHFDDYSAGHVEKYRPPSKGGNTSAIHAHRIEIEGEGYYFMARGSRQWVYKGGRGRFAWYTKDNRCIILRGTLQIWDKDSNPVTRGDHRAKRKQRTAETRMPVSRREMRD